MMALFSNRSVYDNVYMVIGLDGGTFEIIHWCK